MADGVTLLINLFMTSDEKGIHASEFSQACRYLGKWLIANCDDENRMYHFFCTLAWYGAFDKVTLLNSWLDKLKKEQNDADPSELSGTL